MDSYFTHISSGKIFDRSDWWLFIQGDLGAINFYQWLCIRYGFNVVTGSKAGPHISIARHEKPKNIGFWKQLIGKEIYFRYSSQIRWNEEHVWLDIEPTTINELRYCLGLPTFKSYHMTIGRFKHYV